MDQVARNRFAVFEGLDVLIESFGRNCFAQIALQENVIGCAESGDLSLVLDWVHFSSTQIATAANQRQHDNEELISARPMFAEQYSLVWDARDS